ncbi:NB-ARC domain containing protein, partial [Parasponia andersonii]
LSIMEEKEVVLEESKPKKLVDTKDLHQLQVKLKKALEKRRFLFVLNDIWNENYYKGDCLRIYFESGACGIKIVKTTRSEIAAPRMNNVPSYHLQTISSEDCWLLFVKHAFNNIECSEVQPTLEKIG